MPNGKGNLPDETDFATGCEWSQDEDGNWQSGCGDAFVLTDGGPIANGMKFCCYCGLALDELPYEDPEPVDYEDCDGMNGDCTLVKGHEGVCSDVPF